MENKSYTIKSVNEGLKNGEFSVDELCDEYASRIKKENPKLNAYLSVFDSRHNAKISNILNGVPCAVKDNILVKDEKCTAASKILKNYVAPYDATVVTKLKHAGAVFLGKTNLDEFAMGATGENSAFGPTLNPHDHGRVAGGSSAGSAAAVAADLAVYSLGSDTGGSIRAPASFCGVVGLKPTYGLVSRYGLIAMASSLDQIGPITKTVEDAAIVLNAIAGHDSMDSTSSPRVDSTSSPRVDSTSTSAVRTFSRAQSRTSVPNGSPRVDSTSHNRELPDYTKNLNKPISELKIAMPKEFFSEGLDSQVNNCIQKAIAKLGSLGAHVDEVSLPTIKYAIATYYIIVPSEVSANLARYDGIKYGFSSKADSLLDTYLNSRAEGFGPEVKRRIMLGTYALSSGYFDDYYLKAQKVRALIKNDFEKVFEKYDVIVGPTMPYIAPKIGELDNPLSAYLADIYTSPVNLAGLPAISMPCGSIEIDGKNLPVGLQIIGKHFAEEKILQVAYNLEMFSKDFIQA